MTGSDKRLATGVADIGARATLLEQLEQVLERFSSDQQRWPTAQLEILAQFVGSDAEAAGLVKEAGALERVLAVAPARGQRATADLADLIMANARATPRLAASRPELTVIGQGGAATRSVVVGTRWRELALLAASLLIGISIGASQTVGDYVRSMAAEVGVASEVPIAGLEDLWSVGDVSEGLL